MTPTRRAAPEQPETHDVVVVTTGLLLAVLGVVLAVVFRSWLADRGHEDWIAVMVCAVFLGLIGVRRVRRRRAYLSTATTGPDTAETADTDSPPGSTPLPR